MVCPIYDDLRLSLISEDLLVNPAFEGYSDMQKLCFLLSDSRMVRSSAKVCMLTLERRRNFVCNFYSINLTLTYYVHVSSQNPNCSVVFYYTRV